MDCAQSMPKPELTAIIVDMAAKYFKIEDNKKATCNFSNHTRPKIHAAGGERAKL